MTVCGNNFLQFVFLDLMIRIVIDDDNDDDDGDDDLPSEVAAADVRLTTVDGLGQAVVDEDVLVLGLMVMIIDDDH